MRKALLVFAGLLLCVASAGAADVVIQRVTVIDATGKPAQADMTVVISGDRITAVTPSKKAQPAKDARIIDGSGKFLIPGLWDMHVHGTAMMGPSSPYPLYLANGVVGVREMWGPNDASGWRKKYASSDKPAPHIFLASPIIDGPKPIWPGSIGVSSEAQGREIVDQQKERGADFIKVYSLLPHDTYMAIADEARKRSIPFAGHTPIAVTIAEASDAGQKSVEHLTGVALGCSTQEEALFSEIQNAPAVDRRRLTGEAFDSFDENKANSLFARFVKNGTWQCPTLTVLRSIASLDDPKFVNDDRLKYMPKNMRTSWNPKNDFRFKDSKPEDWAELRSQFLQSKKLVGRMNRAGVSIIAGTDVLNPYCFPGFSLHDELTLLVESGLSPMAALQAATRNAAQFMGRLDTQGTIETGKVADLVLLDKDPLADIHNTKSIQAVILGGKLMARTELDRMLAEAEAVNR